MNLLKIVLLLAVCLAFGGCATNQSDIAAGRPSPGKITGTSAGYDGVNPKLLRITAYVDGSGRFIFTNQKVRYEHRNWEPPVDVSFGGEAWSNLAATPALWRIIGHQLNLREAKIVSRKGRDIIALEHTAEGFDLYLCDSPNGGGDYEVTISIPRLK